MEMDHRSGEFYTLYNDDPRALDVVEQEAHPEFVQGIDVSHWQGELTREWWEAAAEQGIRFAFIKATEGIDFFDTRFGANVANAQAVGIKVGAYHFFRPQLVGVVQAVHALTTAGRELDLGIVCDLEITDDETSITISKRVEAFLAQVHAEGVQAWLYASPGFLNSRPVIEPEVPYRKWVAHWTSAPEPSLPNIWSSYDCWQYTSKGTVGGQFPIDMNRMPITVWNEITKPRGCWTDLHRFLKRVKGS